MADREALSGRPCSSCGYDLTGIEVQVCPECGTRTDSVQPHQVWWVPAALLGASALATAIFAVCFSTRVGLPLLVCSVLTHWAAWIWMYGTVLTARTAWRRIKAFVLGTACALIILAAELALLFVLYF